MNRLDRERLARLAEEFCDKSPTNYLSLKAEKTRADVQQNNFARNNLYGAPSDVELLGADRDSGYYGMRFYKAPVFSIGSADDPGFEEIKREDVVGPAHRLPKDWTPRARSVISFFLPFADRTVEANKKDPVEPAMEWLYTRVDGQQHLLALGAHIRDALRAEGYEAATPQIEEEYVMRAGPMPMPGEDLRGVQPYASNWSERHVGYVTGLGTFGRSTNFISKAGCAGRLISVVTSWETRPDEKDYGGVYGYCNGCMACRRKCPGQAYTGDSKDHKLCGEFIHRTCMKYTPRYGCGKCQSGIPCERQPMRAKAVASGESVCPDSGEEKVI
jgi:epoxyqueuosine reductase QueG